jgi:uncharacterized repeat protein (TIGR01451 family)
VSGLPGSGTGAVTDIVFEPNSSNNLLVGVQDLSGGGLDGIYRATNASAAPAASPIFTWTFTPGALENFKLAINKVGTTVTVVSAFGNTSGGQLVKSTDGGQTWPTTVSSFAGFTGFCDGQCWYDIALAMDPTNANKIYLGGSADGSNSSILVKSTDGTTFAQSEGSLHPDEHAMAVAPSDPSIVYTGNDGGVWKSGDSGATWTSLNNSGLNTIQFESLAVHPSDRNFTIGGTQDNGTNWYKPNGTWTRADFGDGGFALIDQSAANTTTVTMYHTYFNQTNYLIGLARVTSTSNASDGNWDFFGCGVGATLNGINCADTTLFYAPMALGPGGPNTLYFGTDRLYRSPNQGTTMTPVSQGPLSSNPVSAIGISPQSDNVRIVGTQDGRVFATTSGSSTLTDVTPPAMTASYVARAVIDPNHSNTAYLTLDAYGFTTHIWKTTSLSTGAAAWAPTNFNVDVPVNAFVVDPTNSQHLFAGTDIGVYASTDGGVSWAPFGTGLPRVAVFDMAIQNSHHILRIATHGRGIWEISLLPSQADLSITKKVTPAFGPPGQAIRYTLTYSNVGSITATGVVITDVVPIAVTGIHFTSSGAPITPTGNLSYTWTVADLVPGAGGIITITGAIRNNLGALPTVVTNTVTIRTTTPESNLLNNSSSANFTVQDVHITGLNAANSSPTVFGQATTFTATVNGGTNVSYAWGFGNGATGTGAITHYIFPAVGLHSVVVTATAGTSQMTATTMVTVNDIPLAVGDAYTTPEDVPLLVAAPGVLANDSDAFPGGLVAQLAGGPTTGVLALAPNGRFTYTAPANFHGLVTFTYRASDGTLSSPAAMVTITVTSVNDPPTLSAPADVTTTAGTPVGPLNFSIHDVDGDPLTVTAQSGNTALVPNGSIALGGSGANRTVSLTPTAGRTGTATITLTVSDGLAVTNNTFILTVTAAEHRLYLPLVVR